MFNREKIYEEIGAFRPLGLMDVERTNDGLAYRRQLHKDACPRAGGVFLGISILEYSFGDDIQHDPRAFVGYRCLPSKSSPTEVEYTYDKSGLYRVVRGDICLNRALFETWNFDDKDRKWRALANRAFWIAHELAYLEQFFELVVDNPPPTDYTNYPQWKRKISKIMKEEVRQSSTEEDRLFVCSTKLLQASIDKVAEKHNKSAFSNYSEFSSQLDLHLKGNESPMVADFLAFWNNDRCVENQLLLDRVVTVLPENPDGPKEYGVLDFDANPKGR